MGDIQLTGYQIEFPKLNKKFYDEQYKVYKIALIYIRLDELQEKASYATRFNKPNRNGTKITFKRVNNAEEYQRELQRIIEDGEALGLKFEKQEKENEK